MDSALITAAGAALDPIVLMAGLIIGVLTSSWRIRLLIAFAVIVAVAFLLGGAPNEPFASLGRGVAILLGISLGIGLRRLRKRASAR